MVIKASRRDMFRGMFGRVGFELPIETAHEVLMRLNGLMDPIPVSVPMWDAYLATRRPLRYTDFARSTSADRAELAREVDQASAHADFARFEGYIAHDLQMLLRVEILLRMWAATLEGESELAPEAAGSQDEQGEPRVGGARRRVIADLVHDELASYLRRQDTEDGVVTARVADVGGYLLKQVRREVGA